MKAVFDAHVHIYPEFLKKERDRIAAREPWFELLTSSKVQKWGTAEELVAAMDEAGFGLAVPAVDTQWTAIFGKAAAPRAPVAKKAPTAAPAFPYGPAPAPPPAERPAVVSLPPAYAPPPPPVSRRPRLTAPVTIPSDARPARASPFPAGLPRSRGLGNRPAAVKLWLYGSARV